MLISNKFIVYGDLEATLDHFIIEGLKSCA